MIYEKYRIILRQEKYIIQGYKHYIDSKQNHHWLDVEEHTEEDAAKKQIYCYRHELKPGELLFD